MKRFLKALSVFTLSLFVLTGACACNNSISDMRQRGREYRQRMQEEQERQVREQTQELPETPTADSETSESPEDDKQPECPDCPEDDKEPECPDCSEEKQKGENGDEPPHHTSPPRKNGRPTPVPFPLPHN